MKKILNPISQKATPAKQNYPLLLPQQLHEHLNQLSQATGQTRAKIIRAALQEAYLQHLQDSAS
ncbi:ribbon-helix-helix protein, CopG family, partial [Cesiribacter andamanensis]|uniref:ribbon-helix-helix protein, CopG family n=1 Tax=Cesiribacter andamanensis TaxID=649507 RepID=UPI00058BE617